MIALILLSLLIVLVILTLLAVFLYFIFRAKRLYITYKTKDDNIKEIMKNVQSMASYFQSYECNEIITPSDMYKISTTLHFMLFGPEWNCDKIRKEIASGIDKIIKSEEAVAKKAMSKQTIEYVNNIKTQILDAVCVDGEIDGKKLVDLFSNMKKAICRE